MISVRRSVGLGLYLLAVLHTGVLPSGATTGAGALTPEAGQDKALPSRVVGRVLDDESGGPIEAAEVRLVGRNTEISRVTDARGAFVFARVPPGAYELVVDHLAYGTRSDLVVLGGAELTRLELRLVMQPIELEPLVVTVQRRHASARIRGFYERLDRGWGDFITREDIEQRRPARVAFIIGELPGVRVIQRHAFGYDIAFTRYGGRCAPTLYLDGIMIFEGWSIDELVLPDDVEGIEVYKGAATVPGEFAGSTAGCGVIAIWTR